MEFGDDFKLRGHITAIVRNKYGVLMDYREFHNLIVSAGKAGAASRLNGAGSEAVFTALALGTGTTAPVIGNTALETEITDSGLARGAATVGRETTTVTDDTATWDKTFTVTGTKAITEIGILNNVASGGTLVGRQVFGSINVVDGYTLQMIYKIIFS